MIYLEREDFDFVTNDHFKYLQYDNDSRQTGDIRDCEGFIEDNNLENFELVATNYPQYTLYMVINHDPVTHEVK